MAFVTIHGLEVQIKDSEWKRSTIYVGDTRGRTSSGALRDGRIATKRRWAGKTPILAASETEWLLGLLDGEGHVFSGESDIYSSKGLIWTGTVPTLSASNFKFGAQSLLFATGATSTISPGYSGRDQTLLVWRRPGSGSFDHYGITRTAAGTIAEVKNGAAGSFTTSNWLTFGASSISFLGKNDAGSNAAVNADDIVVLPFLLTTAQIAALYAETTPWGDLPELEISGDGVDGDTLFALGRCEGVEYVQASMSGTFHADNAEISLSFEEV